MNLAFFDTNILLCGEDASALDKQKLASALFADHLRRNTAVLSVQVLQEYYATVTRKLNTPLERAQRRVEILASAKVIRFEIRDLVAAIELHRLRQISFWDALIVHAARISGATLLYSEDLQHKSVLGGVRIVNPFIN